MKTISAGLKAHLALATTTLATCWQIIRLDGAVFAFTTCDRDLLIDGVTYVSTVGFSRTAIAAGSTGEVDNLEAIGFFDSEGITEQDLVNGLFNFATIFLFIANWADLTQGILRLRRGWLGETVRTPAGAFRVELRGLTQALVQEFTQIFTPACRADLGDTRCKVPIAPAGWVAGATYAAGTFASPAAKSTDALLTAIFVSSGGVAGATEPAWNTAVGATTADGGIVWTSLRPLRLIGTVTAAVDQHNFVASPLSLPAASLGNTALISVRNNASAGTALEISDGTNAVSLVWLFDTAGSTVASDIISHLPGSTQITVTGVSGSTNISLRNDAATQGNITKTGDTALPSGLLITNFTTGYLDGGALTWLTGDNAGTTAEIKFYDASGSLVTTWLALNYAPQIGDRFLYYPGCDKRRETCLNKFANILNFRGEPDIPGVDRMLAYPDS